MSIDPSNWHYVWYRIDEERRKRKWTWAELCKRAHIRMSSWMVGVRAFHPTEDEMHKIADAMGLTYDFIRNGYPGWEPAR